ncbi:zinc-dependent metalloprotease [Halocalculus aciditolerans]|uniref:Zinc-dependent metalloprotease n=1 Tax=Halocalculus aciditolerans TaxID=1383812 RepID=A0A830F448_9EURY|nr:zinc-dependent metalloprotease [Halocalculus aciditolerans]GGL53354.1 hypothetical protein GCM10009039_09420 [Halocalculus aciditolerans]
MSLYESVRAVASASGSGPLDWDAAVDAAKEATPPGRLDLTPEMEAAYASDVRDARERVREVSGVHFAVPKTLEIQNRHHWMEANVPTFRRAFEPLEGQEVALPGVSNTVNTGTMAVALAFIARHVLGQYDPLLLADGDEHDLYFVHPNIVKAADTLDVDFQRFRRWIAFHEVTHAAEFGAAPWLSDFLGDRMRAGVSDLADAKVAKDAFRDLNVAMTAVEGYAELLMDEAFDDDYDDLRRKLDERRNRTNVSSLVGRLLGFQLKQKQYERGRAFFDDVVDARGIEAAARVWDGPDYLPTDAELDNPDAWLARIPRE